MSTDEMDVDTGTQLYLLDLEAGIAYAPAYPATWSTGGEMGEDRIAWVVGREYGDSLRVACPWCQTSRGSAVMHTHGADSDAPDGIHGHRLGAGRGDCSRLGYVVVDRAQLERHIEAREGL